MQIGNFPLFIEFIAVAFIKVWNFVTNIKISLDF